MDCYKDTQLPPKDEFYSNLSMSGISDKEYKHAKRWDDKIGQKQQSIINAIFSILF